MKPLTAFEKMRAQRDRRIRLEKTQEQARLELARWKRQNEFEEQQREEDLRLRFEQIDREHKETMDRVMFDVGMAAWGVDLQTCLFHPKPHKVPTPPVYGGEPYKMMEVERP